MSDIAIVGGGVVGLACAVEFQMRGHTVLLYDNQAPGRHCSFGNAGIIATSEVFPIISPTHIQNLPRMLLSPDAPASIRISAVPALTGWFLRAAKSLGAERQGAITQTLARINALALPAWRDMLEYCGARGLLIEHGMLRLIRRDRDRPHLEKHRLALAGQGIPAELLSADKVHDLEPDLNQTIVGGLLHPTDAHVRNPLEISLALLARFKAGGGLVIEDEVLAIRPGPGRAEVVARKGRRAADKVVVTAGLRSAALVEPFGVRAPLQAERGYHLMMPRGDVALRRPVTFQAESCVATPMGEQIRLAGTVEFAGPSAPPTWSRASRLSPIAQRYLTPKLSDIDAERWIGSRPSLPDSLPAVGRLAACPSVGYAFGHQHLGLTQAAISARLVAQVMTDRASDLDLGPLDIARF